jgi:hypothetical protein
MAPQFSGYLSGDFDCPQDHKFFWCAPPSPAVLFPTPDFRLRIPDGLAITTGF